MPEEPNIAGLIVAGIGIFLFAVMAFARKDESCESEEFQRPWKSEHRQLHDEKEKARKEGRL